MIQFHLLDRWCLDAYTVCSTRVCPNIYLKNHIFSINLSEYQSCNCQSKPSYYYAVKENLHEAQSKKINDSLTPVTPLRWCLQYLNLSFFSFIDFNSALHSSYNLFSPNHEEILNAKTTISLFISNSSDMGTTYECYPHTPPRYQWRR